MCKFVKVKSSNMVLQSLKDYFLACIYLHNTHTCILHLYLCLYNNTYVLATVRTMQKCISLNVEDYHIHNKDNA